MPVSRVVAEYFNPDLEPSIPMPSPLCVEQNLNFLVSVKLGS